ncbi:hypothetical protein VPDG_00111 [Vibrio phage henriette 12B8]|uniref:hypothetical protein n=1 Tax=Vibrio phage henriette 12B8 TaxID=573174 RepID=UPI0002C15D32|nr:hypothetical protein VPDG_00111 [Vibrio phage henriette 12B8]AGG58272.1 hypothetical protein VPDG_00111 [Vibrio phage henriette 12B8]
MSETNERTGGNKTKSLFSMETAIMGLLLSCMAWTVTQIITVRDVQASQTTKQIENDRVNELVYEAIPDIKEAVLVIKGQQIVQSDRMGGLFTVVSNLNQSINQRNSADTNKRTNELIMKYGKIPPHNHQDDEGG